VCNRCILEQENTGKAYSALVRFRGLILRGGRRGPISKERGWEPTYKRMIRGEREGKREEAP